MRIEDWGITGEQDAETPDGSLSNPIFDEIQYDLLTIGK